MAIVPSVANPVTSYDLAVGVKINMDEIIYMISPVDSPLINGVATDGRQILASSPTDQTTFKWMDEELLLPRAAVSVANTATDTSVLSVTVATNDAYRFQIGDLITVMDEGAAQHGAVLRITDPDHGSNPSVMVVTGWANHADQTAIAVGDIVTGLGTALTEGSDPGIARTADRTIRSNNTQIFGPTPIFMSRTEQQIARYGVADEFAKQVYGRSVENVITREQAYLYGQQADNTGTKQRSTGGIGSFITSNVDATSATLTTAFIDAQLQTCYNAGGIPNLLIANPASLSHLNDTENTSTVRHILDDPRRGRVPTMSVLSEFGEVTVVRNRWCNAETAFLVTKENIQRRVIQPLIIEALAKTGDSDKVMLLCEEGLQVQGQSHMAKFTALTGYTGSA